MTDQAKLSFLDLPYLIRSLIYQSLFLDETITMLSWQNRPIPLPSIANTCKQLRAEVPADYHRFARFYVANKYEYEEACSDSLTQAIFGTLRRLVLSLDTIEHAGFNAKLLAWTAEARNASTFRNAMDIILEERTYPCTTLRGYLSETYDNTLNPILNRGKVLQMLQSAKANNLDLTIRYNIFEECPERVSNTFEMSLGPDSSLDLRLTKYTRTVIGPSPDFYAFLKDMGIDVDGEVFQKQFDALEWDGKLFSMSGLLAE